MFVWMDFIRHLRFGKVKRTHVKMLRPLITGQREKESVNFEIDPRGLAALVKPRHTANGTLLRCTRTVTVAVKKKDLRVCIEDPRL